MTQRDPEKKRVTAASIAGELIAELDTQSELISWVVTAYNNLLEYIRNRYPAAPYPEASAAYREVCYWLARTQPELMIATVRIWRTHSVIDSHSLSMCIQFRSDNNIVVKYSNTLDESGTRVTSRILRYWIERTEHHIEFESPDDVFVFTGQVLAELQRRHHGQ